MFELEDFAGANTLHDGLLNKYAENGSGSYPNLDFYISDSLQEVLDVDIRSEIANVVNGGSEYGGSEELASINYDLTDRSSPPSSSNSSSFGQTINGNINKDSSYENLMKGGTAGVNGVNNNNNNNVGGGGGNGSHHYHHFKSDYGLISSNSSSLWFGSSSDIFADVGECVNPISVMPLVTTSLMHRSPRINLNANSIRSNSPSQSSPNVSDTKSHLTFSPAHIKISANSLRNEQLTSHIPKQIMAVTNSTAISTIKPLSNISLQKRNGAISNETIDINSGNGGSHIRIKEEDGASGYGINSVKKDLTAEMNKLLNAAEACNNLDDTAIIPLSNINKKSSNKIQNGIKLLCNNDEVGNVPSSKQLQQSQFVDTMKTIQGSCSSLSSIATNAAAVFTNNGNAIVIKREDDNGFMHQVLTSSPLTKSNNNNSSNSSTPVGRILSRNVIQTSTGLTPKSIASSLFHSIHSQQQQQQIMSSANGKTFITTKNGQIITGGPVRSTSLLSSVGGNHLNNSQTIVTNGIQYSNTLKSNGVITGSPLASSSPTAIPSSYISNNMSVRSVQQQQSQLQQQHKTKTTITTTIDSEYPKPAYSYSCLIALALKNSCSGSLPVSDIYNFMCDHFPYFKTAPNGWKNSVRHNLSLNKCFEKIEKSPLSGNQRKGCLWAMNPERIGKMDEEVQKWSRKDPMAIRNAMLYPDNLEALERGELKYGDASMDVDNQSEIEDASDFEQELDEGTVDNILVEEDLEDEELALLSTNMVDDGQSTTTTSMLNGGNATSTLGDNVVIFGTNKEISMQDIGISGAQIVNTTAANMSLYSTCTMSPLSSRDDSRTTSINEHVMCSPLIESEEIFESLNDINEDEDDNGEQHNSSSRDIIELNPADYEAIDGHDGNNHQILKRVRLNDNYPTIIHVEGGVDNHFKGQNLLESINRLEQQEPKKLNHKQNNPTNFQIRNIKKITKIQSVRELPGFQFHLTQQQEPNLIVQTIAATATKAPPGTTQYQQQQEQPQQQQQQQQQQQRVNGVVGILKGNGLTRRKLQMVNRIGCIGVGEAVL